MTFWRAPGPVPLIAAVVVVAVTAALGNWQLNRAHEKEARAARLAAMGAQPPLVLTAAPLEQDAAERRVQVRGRFDAAHTVLLDNRPHAGDGRAGFLALTPLRISEADGRPGPRAVLVLRGWLPRDMRDRTRIAPFPTPSEEISLGGTALKTVPRVYSLGQDASAEAGRPIRQNVDLAAFSSELGVPLQPLVIEQRTDTGDGLARDWPAADLGADRHYGYAFQWFGLAALTVALVIVLGWRRARRQRQPLAQHDDKD